MNATYNKGSDIDANADIVAAYKECQTTAWPQSGNTSAQMSNNLQGYGGYTTQYTYPYTTFPYLTFDKAAVALRIAQTLLKKKLIAVEGVPAFIELLTAITKEIY